MTWLFLQSLALFLPILAANQSGRFIRVARLPDVAISKKWLGKNKTLMPYLIAPALAAVVELLYHNPEWWFDSLVLGWGAILGDHGKSFIKRRFGYQEGSPFFLDRIDFALGGGLAAWLFFPWVTVGHLLCLVGIAWPVHYFGNRFSHSQGWRDTPH